MLPSRPGERVGVGGSLFTLLKFSHCCRADFREALNVDGPFIDSPAAGKQETGKGTSRAKGRTAQLSSAQVFSSSANSFNMI